MLNLDAAPPPLILASSSKYRAELLARLSIPFAAQAPDIDERILAGEDPAGLVQRLAAAKARKLERRDCWVLGSDQAAECAGRILGKPGHRAAAVAQLEFLSAKTVHFHTAVALAGNGQLLQTVDLTTVRFRNLDRRAIERYLAAEPAYDCAGSFKAEGYGITLFEAIDSRDPTALIGLPLISTSQLLREAGFDLP